MTYPYIRASLSARGTKGNDPKSQYVELFQQTLNEQFYNASDWWTVMEEMEIGSDEFSETDVRITHVINAETGLKLGDDWKSILFKDINHPIELGRKYIFDNNTWITINTEIFKNLTGSCTVRRCNNTLRWVDEPTGAYYEEPCVIEYLVKEPRDYSTSGSPFMTPGGFLHIEMQFNDVSNLIKENQRFLFGNSEHWTCYKVIGTGINDFRNTETYDARTAKILTLDLIANFVNNELDDVINGIADVYTNVYTLTLNHSVIEGSIGDTSQLSAVITYNGNTASRDITWSSSNTNIATVNSSGLVTFVANGTAIITATIENNPANDTCGVTVTPSPSILWEVAINPTTNYILEGADREYSVYLYEDGVQQADAFTITCNANGIPATSFTFTQVDSNHFRVVNNLRSVSSYLIIQAVSGTNTKLFNIYLRGAWQ